MELSAQNCCWEQRRNRTAELNKNQHNAHFLHQCFNLIMMSSTCFGHLSVHPQEDLYVQFYGISFMHPYKQSGRCQVVLDTAIDRNGYMDA